MRSRTVCGALLICTFASPLAADPIQVSPTRTVEALLNYTDPSGSVGSGIAFQRTTDVGSFRARLRVAPETELGIGLMSATVLQDTTIDSLNGHFFGSGSSSVTSSLGVVEEVDRSDAFSAMSVDFVLSRATPYHFTATVNLSTVDGFVYAFLIGGPQSGSQFNFGAEGDPPAMPILWKKSGMLPAGLYEFAMHAETFRPGSAGWDVDFALGKAVTPEPASLGLVSVGLIGAAARCRRRGCSPGSQT